MVGFGRGGRLVILPEARYVAFVFGLILFDQFRLVDLFEKNDCRGYADRDAKPENEIILARSNGIFGYADGGYEDCHASENRAYDV